MKGKRFVQVWAVLALLASLGIGVGGASSAGAASAMDELGTEAAAGTAFTYQGQLRDEGGTVNDTCDLQFKLWDAAAGGAQVGSTILLEDVLVEWGLFTARLDFGAAAFRGQARYLEVGVACPAGSGLVVLPRQELTGSPYALWALGAPWTGLVGVPADLADGDQDTTYSAGAGLVLEGTEFRVNRGEVQWRVSQTCAAGSSIRAIDMDGTVTCETDDNTTYGAGTGLSLVGGQFSVNFAGTGSAGTASRSDHNHDAAYVNEGQANSVSTGMVQNSTLLLEDLNQNGCGTGQVIKWSGSAWACAADATGGTSFWSLTGNAGTAPGTNYLGTSDNAALEIKVNGARALRLEPNAVSPNIVAGYSGNVAWTDVYGASIGGGGAAAAVNGVYDLYGTVGGGVDNAAYGEMSTVGGGGHNLASHKATVGGGEYNHAEGDYSVVAGGDLNHAGGSLSVIGGGESISVTGYAATVAGGAHITVTASYATVGGGRSNAVTDDYGTVAGGYNNQAGDNVGTPDDQPDATVGGGRDNIASGYWATVGGGDSNMAIGGSATIGGGLGNTANGQVAFIGGGANNTVSGGNWSTVCGGYGNTVEDYSAIVAGGFENTASNNSATVAGGHSNTAAGAYAAIGGGEYNTASGAQSSVSGGWTNTASGQAATVGGGYTNVAQADSSTVGGGWVNAASGNAATVPGGAENQASGGYSFAAGAQAHATHTGSFVWSSATATDSWGTQTFTVRSHGGARFYSSAGTGTGVQLAAGGTSFASISDRNAKEVFAPVDTAQLLEVLASMPVQTWNLKSQAPEMRHIGPVAQDFNGSFAYLFGEVESPIHINNMDAVGISLAASQGLYEQNLALQAENAAQQAQIDELEARLAALEAGQGASPLSARLPSGWLLLGGGVIAAGAVVGRRVRGGER